MKLLGYIRVSTEDQASNGHSLDAQMKSLQRYCELYEHVLVDVLVEGGTSAFKVRLANRKAGSELVRRLDSGVAQGFVFTRLDRVFRSAMDGINSLDWITRREISLHCVEGNIDTSTPDGEFMFIVRLATDQRESRVTSARCREVSQFLKGEGRVYGPVPYGLTKVRAGRDVRGNEMYELRKDPVTWPHRCTIVRLRGEGGLTLRAIAKHCREQDIPPPRKGGKNWSHQTIAGICESHHEFEHIPLLCQTPDASISLTSSRAFAGSI